MTIRGNVVGSLLVGAVALVAVTSCSSTAGNYADLSAEPSAEDDLPAELYEDDALSEVSLESVRAVGSHEGVELWLAEAATPGQVCLVAFAEDAAYQVTCGTTFTTGGQAGAFLVVPDTNIKPDDATKPVSANVYALDS